MSSSSSYKSAYESAASATASSNSRHEHDDDHSSNKKQRAIVDHDLDVHQNHEPKRVSSFGKIWSDEDEVVLLKGVLRFIQEKGKEPKSNVQEFHDFISASLQRNFSKTQVSDKLRRLKKKYSNNAAKGKSVSINHHEKVLFDLSTSIWGTICINNIERKPAVKAEAYYTNRRSAVVSGVVGSIFTEFLRSSNLSYGEDLMKKYATGLIGNHERNEEREKKWVKVAIQELELLTTKCDLLNEEVTALLEILRSQ